MTAESILVLNGPNLNLLGAREPEIYGTETLADIEERIVQRARELGCSVELRQENDEGQLIEAVQSAPRRFAGIVCNPGAYAHYSYALADAITAAGVPLVEVHISNTFAREDFRKTSVTARAALGLVAGLGTKGYELALEALVSHIRASHPGEPHLPDT